MFGIPEPKPSYFIVSHPKWPDPQWTYSTQIGIPSYFCCWKIFTQMVSHRFFHKCCIFRSQCSRLKPRESHGMSLLEGSEWVCSWHVFWGETPLKFNILHITRWWCQICFGFHPYLGKISILNNIFQLGWSHQLDNNHGGFEDHFPVTKGWCVGSFFISCSGV